MFIVLLDFQEILLLFYEPLFYEQAVDLSHATIYSTRELFFSVTSLADKRNHKQKAENLAAF